MRQFTIITITKIVEKIWYIYDVLSPKIFKNYASPQPVHTNRYISGNFFKSISDVVINDESISDLFGVGSSETVNTLNLKKLIYFIEMSNTQPINFLNFSEKIPKGSKVIFHNGDLLHIFDLKLLKEKDIAIYAVNAINDNSIVALPIGLENQELNKNGKVDEFMLIDDLKPPEYASRSIYICVNFRLRTNYSERLNVLKTISRLRLAKFFWFKTPKEIHTIYRKSLFVISPPGNGFDCHRTWEALYLGAVPIVLKSKIDTNLIKGLPVWVVDDYSEVHKYSKAELKVLYIKLWNNADLEKIRTPYWLSLING